MRCDAPPSWSSHAGRMAAGFAGAVKVRLTDRCNRDGALCQRQTQMSSSKRTGTLALSRFQETKTAAVQTTDNLGPYCV